MQSLQDIRAKFPQYSDLSDQQLADALHQKYYSDISQADFYGRIGFNQQTEAPVSAPPRSATVRLTGQPIIDTYRQAGQDALDAGQSVLDYFKNNDASDVASDVGSGISRFTDYVADRGLGVIPDAANALIVEPVKDAYNKGMDHTANALGMMADPGNYDQHYSRAVASGADLAPIVAEATLAGKGARILSQTRQGKKAAVTLKNTAQSAQDGLKRARDSAQDFTRQGVKKFNDRDAKLSPEQLAEKRLRESLDDDGLSVDELQRRASEWQGVRPPTLLDLADENTVQRIKNTASNIGPARKTLSEYSQGVLANQEANAREIFARNLSDKDDYLKELDALAEQRETASRPLYDAAHAEAVQPSGNIKLIAGTQNGQQAIRWALRIANADGVQLEGVFKRGNRYMLGGPEKMNKLTGARTASPAVPVQTLDYIKQGFDDLVERYRDKATRKLVLDKQGNATNNQRRRLITEIDELSPAYRQAREAWAGPSATLDAMDRGRKYFSSDKSPADITRVLRDPNMTASEKEFFRAGAVQALLRNIQKRVDGANKFNAVSRSTDSRAKLVALFEGDEARADAFMKQFVAENQRSQRAIDISPKTGSQTNPRDKAQGHFSIMDALELNSPGALTRLGGRALNLVRTKKQLQRQQEIDAILAQMATRPVTTETLSLLPIN